jgi:hypothetical protein
MCQSVHHTWVIWYLSNLNPARADADGRELANGRYQRSQTRWLECIGIHRLKCFGILIGVWGMCQSVHHIIHHHIHHLLLPAATQCTIELYKRVQLVHLCLGQIELGRKIISLIGQNFQITRRAALVPYIGEMGRILGRSG